MTSHVADSLEYEPELERYRARYERCRDVPSLAVVEAVVAIEDVGPTDLHPFGDTVDTDALDSVIRSTAPDADVEVSVTYQGYRVTVRGDGHLELRPEDADAGQ